MCDGKNSSGYEGKHMFPIESIGWEMCMLVQVKKVDDCYWCMFLALLMEVLTTSMMDFGG